MPWYELKLFVAHVSGVSMDALHVIVGILVHLAAAAALRSEISRWRPWLLLLGLELANEAGDLFAERWPHPGMQLGEGTKDLLLTMLMPTLLMLGARYRPSLFSAATPSE